MGGINNKLNIMDKKETTLSPEKHRRWNDSDRVHRRCKKRLIRDLVFDELERRSVVCTKYGVTPDIIIPDGVRIPFLLFKCLMGYNGKYEIYEIYECFGWRFSMDYLKHIVGFNPTNIEQYDIFSGETERLKRFIADKLGTTTDKIELCGTLRDN